LNSNEIRLPIQEPLITGYKHHALPLAILQANHSSAAEAILPCFLQLYTAADVMRDPGCDPHWLDYCIYEYLTEMNPNPFLHVTQVSRETISENELEGFILQSLMQGKYLYVYYNSYYLPNNSAYLNTSFINNLLIYGYSKQKRACHIYDYDYITTNKLKEMTMPITDLCDAIYSLGSHAPAWSSRILLLEPATDLDISVDPAYIYRQLSDYLHAKPTFDRYKWLEGFGHSVMKLQDHPIYGVEVYEVLRSYITDIVPHAEWVNGLPLYILKEHKQIMEKIMTLIDFNEKDRMIRDFHHLVLDVQIINNMFAKYTLSREKQLLTDIRQRLLLVKEREITLLTMFLNKWHG